MFRSLAALALCAVASLAPADEKPRPNALTPKEVADGWILLFDGETIFGWEMKGAVTLTDSGRLVLAGQGATVTSTTALGAGELKLVYAQTGPGAVTVKWGAESAELRGDPAAATASKTLISKGGRAAPVEFAASDKGGLSLSLVAYRPTNTVPLFNGKDLTGWTVNDADPKRKASKWSVTKDGELAVKDGPGDLVSEKQFDNFVLQFECKTLGKALNSGVFFRCIPGQYQNGYEAQIQNAYKDGDRTKPADLGTGAIYRRAPARKVVSDDGEWFTMTLVANGKRISTWVNGYQTVDWVDDRKENENPRQGFRAAKGPLSIQGHDPATDILFRNIRIAELTRGP